MLHNGLASPQPNKNYFQRGLSIIRQVQGIGSGADVAAVVYGGVVSYHMQPLKIQVTEHLPNLYLIYCGYKTPTATVVKQINKQESMQPEQFAEYIPDSVSLVDNNCGKVTNNLR